MNAMIRTTLATALLGCGLGMLPSARAATQSSSYYINPAQACQLSIPTIDTVVAPRANGYRNAGITGAFVICGFSKMNSSQLANAGIQLISLDGQVHSVSCTGVNGVANISTQTYVSKTVVVSGTGYNSALFYPSDFGSSGTIPGSEKNFSITCNLQPQVAIILLLAGFSYEIGT